MDVFIRMVQTAGMANEVVPGMAEAIEARRIELGLTPGELVARSGLTAPGLAPLRKGYRRTYEDRTRFALADALQWERDAVDRLLAGKAPVRIEVDGTDDDKLAQVLGRLEEVQADVRRLVDLMGVLAEVERGGGR